MRMSARGQLAATDRRPELGDVVDSRGVDELESAGQHACLHVELEHARVVGRDLGVFGERAFGEPVEALGLQAHARFVVAPQVGAWALAFSNDDGGARGRRDSRGQHVLAEQCVDQRALALLDLSEHDRTDAGVRETTLGVLDDGLAELGEAQVGGDRLESGGVLIEGFGGVHSSPSLRVSR